MHNRITTNGSYARKSFGRVYTRPTLPNFGFENVDEEVLFGGYLINTRNRDAILAIENEVNAKSGFIKRG